MDSPAIPSVFSFLPGWEERGKEVGGWIADNQHEEKGKKTREQRGNRWAVLAPAPVEWRVAAPRNCLESRQLDLAREKSVGRQEWGAGGGMGKQKLEVPPIVSSLSNVRCVLVCVSCNHQSAQPKDLTLTYNSCGAGSTRAGRRH